MPRLDVAPRGNISAEFLETLEEVELSFGFVPNAFLTMAHGPPILKAFSDLGRQVMRVEGEVPVS